jgi:hypothetical protein
VTASGEGSGRRWRKILYFILCSVYFAVRLSSTGAINRFKEMTPATSGVMAEVSLTLPYPEPFRVTGPLPSLVLRTEDMWQKYKPFFVEVGIRHRQVRGRRSAQTVWRRVEARRNHQEKT